MSKIEVDAIEPQSGTSLTLGASGDTITVPSGATLDVTSATVSGITSYTDTDALTLFNATGSAPVFACRTFVNFDGTGTPTIREDGNVTSITDNGTGTYTINFTTAMSDANYAVTALAGGSDSSLRNVSIPLDDGNPPTTSSVRINVTFANASLADVSYVAVAIFH